MIVPWDFQEEVERARKAGRAGDLRLLAEEARGFEWGGGGLRLVGEAQFGIRALAGAKETFEALRQLDPDDLLANYRLGTIYQKLAESMVNVETKLDCITLSEQRLRGCWNARSRPPAITKLPRKPRRGIATERKPSHCWAATPKHDGCNNGGPRRQTRGVRSHCSQRTLPIRSSII
jgi:hypothetical protein